MVVIIVSKHKHQLCLRGDVRSFISYPDSELTWTSSTILSCATASIHSKSSFCPVFGCALEYATVLDEVKNTWVCGALRLILASQSQFERKTSHIG